MKILTTYSHQTRLHNFGVGELPHDIYVPPSEAKWTDTVKGDYKYCYPAEEVPNNLHFDETLEDPDVVLSAGGGDVNILHDLHTRPREDALNIYQTERQLVHNPPPDECHWLLIRHGVDRNKFEPGWEGGDGNIITFWNNMRGRPTTRRRSVQYADALRDAFGDDFKVYGYDNADGWIRNNAEAMRTCEIYVNIRTRGFAPFNVAEAMTVGAPIVSASHPTVQDDIIHPKNGVIASSPKKMVEAIENLLDDDSRRSRMSNFGQYVAKKRFDLRRNIEKWDHAIRLARVIE